MILLPALPLTTHMKPYAHSLISPYSSLGSTWPLSPSCWADLVAPTPHFPFIHCCRMGTPQRASHRSPSGCWGTSPSGLSPSVTRYPTRLVIPPGWPVLVLIPCHTIWWVSRWLSQVGVGDAGAAMAEAALCEDTWRPGRSSGRMCLASLSRRKSKGK